MKIAIFADNFYPEISGISDSVVLLAKELSELGHEIHFFAPKYSAKDHAKANLPNKELDLGENIKFHRFWSLPFLGSPTGQSRIVIPYGLSLLKFHKEKFDIIYTQDPYGMGMEALLMSKMFGIPMIGTNHTPITEFTSYLPLSNKFFDWIGLNFVSWYYNRCKFVTAPYAKILEEMKTYGLKRDSMELSNPIDLKNFIAPSEEQKNKLKEKYALSKNTVIYTGRLAPEKQVDVIIKAVAEIKKTIPDVMLVITGIGNAQDDLRKMVKKLGLENSVKFFGRVDDDTHIELYQASDVFSVMSTAETQCISMMKAMSVGIPSVAADAWALPNYLGRDEKRGFVVPVGDSLALAEKLQLLLHNTALAKRMGEEGKLYVQNFSARGVAEKWQEIFKKFSNQTVEQVDNLKLSIVIPAYNEERYLGKCLEAVFNEIEKSNRDIEVVVVDNASTDKTSEIAKSFSGVKLVYEPKKGLSQARHSGYLASAGDIIANVDSDSTIPAGWIEKVFVEFSKNPNLVALSGPYLYPEMPRLTNFMIHVYYFIGLIGHIINHHFFKIGAMLQGGNFVLRRTALEKVGGYDTTIGFYGEDTDIARRIQKVGLVKFMFEFKMHTSSRRFEEEGIIMTGLRYITNHFWVIIFKRPFSKAYNDIRDEEI